MYRLSLISISFRNLVARPGRTAFLLTGILLGTCVLTVLFGLSSGFGRIVEEDILDAKHETLQELQANLDQQEELLATLPVHRLDLLPSDHRTEISESTVRKEVRGVEGVVGVQPVAFLFPIFSQISLKDFVIQVAGGMKSFDLSRMAPRGRRNLIPTTVYGYSTETLEGRFHPIEGETLEADFRSTATGEPIPVIVSTQWMDKLNNLRNEEMNERLAEMMAEAMVKEKNPKARQRITDAFKTELLKGPMAGTIQQAAHQVYDKLRPSNLRKHLELRLIPDVTRGTVYATQIVGHSQALPFDGIGIPVEYVRTWQREYFDRTTSALGKLFSRKPELQYSRVTVLTAGLDETLRLIQHFESIHFKVEADADAIAGLKRQEENLLRQKQALDDEGERFAGFEEVTRAFAFPVAGLMLLLAGIGIAMGLSLSVIEQSRRIGILRAVGARKIDILFIFMVEAFLLGFVGSLLGVATGRFGSFALDFRLREALSGSTYIPSTLFDLSNTHLATVTLLGIAFSLVAGILPAVMAARIRPIEVLKG